MIKQVSTPRLGKRQAAAKSYSQQSGAQADYPGAKKMHATRRAHHNARGAVIAWLGYTLIL